MTPIPRHLFRRAALAALLFGSFVFNAFAADTSAKKSFDVPAGDAISTLKTFMTQADTKLLYSADAVRKVQTKAVKGNLTAADALNQMLEGTGLEAKQNSSDGALGVTRASSPNVQRAIAEASDRPSEKANVARTDDGALKLDTFEVFAGRSLNMDVVRSADDPLPYSIFDRQEIEQSGATDIMDFLRQRLTMMTSYSGLERGGTDALTGGAAASLSAANNEVGSFLYSGLNSTVSLRGLSAAETLILVDGHRYNGVSTSNGNLGFGQGDISGIPLSAIERVEVLPMSAAGIYGGNATAGVINIVLRRDFSATEIKFTYDNTFDTDSARKQVDFTSGFSLNKGKTHVMLSGSYSTQNALLMQDRDFYQRGRALALSNSTTPATIPGYASSTTNIQAVSQVLFPVSPDTPGAMPIGFGNLYYVQVKQLLTLKPTGTPLNASTTYVPYGYSGPQSDNGAGFIAKAGQYNADLAQTAGGALAYLQTAPEKYAANLTIRQELSPKIEAFVEVSTQGTRSTFQQPALIVGSGSSSVTLSRLAAANPFLQDVIIYTPFVGADTPVTMKQSQARLVGGVIVKLPKEWQAEADYVWQQSRYSTANRSPYLNKTAVADAIGNGTVNVFRDPARYPIDFSPYLINIDRKYLDVGPIEAYLGDATIRLAGPLASFPAGEIASAGLIEYRQEGRRDIYNGDQASVYAIISGGSGQPTLRFSSAVEQASWSIYQEFKIPLVAPAQHLPMVNSLELQLAGRYESYRTIGGATYNLPISVPIARPVNQVDSANPTVAVGWRPTSDFLVRASYGTGFLPPNIGQLIDSRSTYSGPSSVLLDPRRGNEPVGTYAYTVLAGGNFNLKPEHSQSSSAGIVWSPHQLAGLRLSVDWSHIEKRDNINSVRVVTTADLALESLVPGLITRDAVTPGDPFGVGPITEIDTRLRNFYHAESESVDATLSYQLETKSIGTFSLNLAATRLLRVKQQVSPGAPVIDLLSNQGNLEWRGNGTLSWQFHRWMVGWSTNYYDWSWLLNQTALGAAGEHPSTLPFGPLVQRQGSAKMSSEWVHDAFLSYTSSSVKIGGRSLPWLTGTRVQVGVRNLFNNRGDPNANTYASDPTIGPRLASYYVSLKLQF